MKKMEFIKIVERVGLAGVIHQFKAGDLSHLEREAIYKVLEGLIENQNGGIYSYKGVSFDGCI